MAANGSLVPDFAEPEMDPDEMLSDEDAPDLQDEIAKTLTSLRVRNLHIRKCSRCLKTHDAKASCQIRLGCIQDKRSGFGGLEMQVADLKAMCKERGITGFSKHRKSQLVRVLKDAMLVESE